MGSKIRAEVTSHNAGSYRFWRDSSGFKSFFYVIRVSWENVNNSV